MGELALGHVCQRCGAPTPARAPACPRCRPGPRPADGAAFLKNVGRQDTAHLARWNGPASPAMGRRLQQAREAAGLTQSDLGGLVRAGHTTIAALERGRRAPSAAALEALAAALGVEADWLRGGPPPASGAG